MKILNFETSEILAFNLAKLIVRKINESSGVFNLAVSGGSTPKILLKELSETFIDEVDWSKLNIYWVDERCVPPGDDQSNFKMTDDILLSKINFEESMIHRIRGEKSPKEEAKRYQTEILENIPVEGGTPVFDMVLLGMGDDGHTASIFPDNVDVFYSSNFVENTVNPYSKQNRITLTGSIITSARDIVFMATGKNKAEIFKNVIEKDEKYPASHVLMQTDNIRFYVDDEILGKS